MNEPICNRFLLLWQFNYGYEFSLHKLSNNLHTVVIQFKDYNSYVFAFTLRLGVRVNQTGGVIGI